MSICAIPDSLFQTESNYIATRGDSKIQNSLQERRKGNGCAQSRKQKQSAVSQQSPTLITMLISEQLQTVLSVNVSLPTLPNYVSPLYPSSYQGNALAKRFHRVCRRITPTKGLVLITFSLEFIGNFLAFAVRYFAKRKIMKNHAHPLVEKCCDVGYLEGYLKY